MTTRKIPRQSQDQPKTIIRWVPRGACCPCIHQARSVGQARLRRATAHWVRRWAIARFAILSHATHYGRKFLFVTRTWPVYNSRVGWVARHRLANAALRSELVKKWGLAPPSYAYDRENHANARCLSPFFHKFSAKGNTIAEGRHVAA